MSTPQQSFANHSKTPTSLIVYSVVYAIAIVAAAAALYLYATGEDGGVVLSIAVLACGIAGVGSAVMSRYYALCLQDRIIRLEMQVRLERVLPEDLRAQANRLTLKQLIGLRFASDPELPELVRATLAENPESAAWIKKQIKQWQPDHQRV